MTIEEDAVVVRDALLSVDDRSASSPSSSLQRLVAHDALDRLVTSAQRLQEAVDVVNRQAEDEMIWFAGQTIAEAYLQQALRYLHSVVEGPDSE